MSGVGAVEVGLGARLNVVRLLLTRENVWSPDAVVFVGPDTLEGVVRFQGVAVVRVEHWPGEAVLALPAGYSRPEIHDLVRRLQLVGLAAGRLRLFGPPGIEYHTLFLMDGPPVRSVTVHGVPVHGLDGPMIGVELT